MWDTLRVSIEIKIIDGFDGWFFDPFDLKIKRLEVIMIKKIKKTNLFFLTGLLYTKGLCNG